MWRFTQVLFSIALAISTTGPVLAFSDIFERDTSLACGIAQCQIRAVYKTCQTEGCGTRQASESCGDHWGPWYEPGGSPGFPCPQGCNRGSEVGSDFRAVGFPPRPQVKKKFQCTRSITVANSCSNAACGVDREEITGGLANYNTCVHPVHGIAENRWQAAYAQADVDRKAILSLYQLVGQLFASRGAEDKRFVDARDPFTHAAEVTVLFLQRVAEPRPQDHRQVVDALIAAFEGNRLQTIPADIEKVVGTHNFSFAVKNVPERSFACQRS